MKIKQFRYLADNFSYLIHGKKLAAAIDGGAVEKIFSYVEEQGLELVYVANTHSHPDHTMGNSALLKGSTAEYLDNQKLLVKGGFEIEDLSLRIFATPGHTDDSVIFYAAGVLFTGDTLFNGTVGNCFSGNLKRFYHSIKMLMGFSGETIVYAGHDYVAESMMFAKKLEPSNIHIDRFLNRYNPSHVCSTLSEEFNINPFFRLNESAIVSFLTKMGLPASTEYERWEALMSVE